MIVFRGARRWFIMRWRYMPPPEVTVCTTRPREAASDHLLAPGNAALSNGVNADTIPQLPGVLPGVASIDRTSINACELQRDWNRSDTVEAFPGKRHRTPRRGWYLGMEAAAKKAGS
jgi:hypothetical protein